MWEKKWERVAIWALHGMAWANTPEVVFLALACTVFAAASGTAWKWEGAVDETTTLHSYGAL